MPKCAVQVAVASAVADAMNDAPSGTWSRQFQAVWNYADWSLSLQEDGLFVDVVPGGVRNYELGDRGEVEYLVDTDIVIRERLQPGDRRASTGRLSPDELGVLSLLTEEMAEFWTGDRLDDLPRASWEESEFRVSYARDHLQIGQWTSVIRVTHRVFKPFGEALTCSE